jgi:hypothetical protein
MGASSSFTLPPPDEKEKEPFSLARSQSAPIMVTNIGGSKATSASCDALNQDGDVGDPSEAHRNILKYFRILDKIENLKSPTSALRDREAFNKAMNSEFYATSDPDPNKSKTMTVTPQMAGSRRTSG